MALVRPFSRRGYSVDLAGSDRARGVVVFRPLALPAVPGRRSALRCTMRLERPHREKFRVIRALEADDHRVATMTAEGDDPEVLLEVVEEVAPERHFHDVEGRLVVRSYRVEVWVRTAPQRGLRRPPDAWPRLTGAEAHLGHLRLSATETRGPALEVRLTADQGRSLDIPRDFLAVIGWSWRPLRRLDEHTWLGSVRPPKREPRRTATLESELDAAISHVAETLAASPTLYHHQHREARWRAAFQRLLPLLSVCGAAIGAFLAVTYLPRTPVFHMLVFYLSILVVVGLVLLDKAYRLEIPARPSPLKQSHWWVSSDGGLAPVDDRWAEPPPG